MDRETIKKVAYTLGKILGFLGLIFVLYKLSTEYTLESFYTKLSAFASLLPLLIFLNLLSSVVGIYVWHLMLKGYAKKEFGYLSSYYYFAKTEIAKYLPGNLFHFIGRQALASKLLISQVEMAKISLLFTTLLAVGTLIAATLFALLADTIDIKIKATLCFVTVAAVAGVLFTYPTFTKSQKLSFAFTLAFSIALQGVILALIIGYQIDSINFGLFAQTASIYILSWLIGFVTPGASGGLGVREGAFIAIANFVHLSIASEVVIFSIFFIRFINILVDMLMFFSTFAIGKRYNGS
jgi:hypothetical protein